MDLSPRDRPVPLWPAGLLPRSGVYVEPECRGHCTFLSRRRSHISGVGTSAISWTSAYGMCGIAALAAYRESSLAFLLFLLAIPASDRIVTPCSRKVTVRAFPGRIGIAIQRRQEKWTKWFPDTKGECHEHLCLGHYQGQRDRAGDGLPSRRGWAGPSTATREQIDKAENPADLAYVPDVSVTAKTSPAITAGSGLKRSRAVRWTLVRSMTSAPRTPGAS
jgi:hypothetical protein